MAELADFRILCQRIEDVLTQERAALKTGRYDQLAALADIQEDLLSQLAGNLKNAPAAATPNIRQLSVSAARNRRLISAALAGIRSAGRRMQDITDAQKTTQTYNRAGLRTRLEPELTVIERRS